MNLATARRRRGTYAGVDEDATSATRWQNLTYDGEPAAGRHFPAFEQRELFIVEFKTGIGSLPD